MNTIILGNIIAFVGCVLMVIIGFIKSKRNILRVQNLQFIILGISNIILGGISGAVSNLVGLLRNIVCIKYELTLLLKIVFIVIQAVLTIFSNNMGIAGWLPFAAAVMFTAVLDSKNEVVLKTAIIGGELCWLVYDFLIINYSGVAFDGFTVVSNLVGIYLVIKERKKVED